MSADAVQVVRTYADGGQWTVAKVPISELREPLVAAFRSGSSVGGERWHNKAK
jgi:hypothetical protein